MQADVLDLSLVTSEYGRNIHPCKGCVSSAMPLCFSSSQNVVWRVTAAT